MLCQFWVSVRDAGPELAQHWTNFTITRKLTQQAVPPCPPTVGEVWCFKYYALDYVYILYKSIFGDIIYIPCATWWLNNWNTTDLLSNKNNILRLTGQMCICFDINRQRVWGGAMFSRREMRWLPGNFDAPKILDVSQLWLKFGAAFETVAQPLPRSKNNIPKVNVTNRTTRKWRAPTYMYVHRCETSLNIKHKYAQYLLLCKVKQ